MHCYRPWLAPRRLTLHPIGAFEWDFTHVQLTGLHSTAIASWWLILAFFLSFPSVFLLRSQWVSMQANSASRTPQRGATPVKNWLRIKQQSRGYGGYHTEGCLLSQCGTPSPLYQPSPPLPPDWRPAVNRRRPATESSVMALGLMMKPPWLYQFPPISRSPPPVPSLPPPAAAMRHGTLYESVASSMLKSPSLRSIFPPSVVSQSQLSVCCVARRAAGESCLLVELGRGKDERRKPGGGRGGRSCRHQNSGAPSTALGCTRPCCTGSQSANPMGPKIVYTDEDDSLNDEEETEQGQHISFHLFSR